MTTSIAITYQQHVSRGLSTFTTRASPFALILCEFPIMFKIYTSTQMARCQSQATNSSHRRNCKRIRQDFEMDERTARDSIHFWPFYHPVPVLEHMPVHPPGESAPTPRSLPPLGAHQVLVCPEPRLLDTCLTQRKQGRIFVSTTVISHFLFESKFSCRLETNSLSSPSIRTLVSN